MLKPLLSDPASPPQTALLQFTPGNLHLDKEGVGGEDSLDNRLGRMEMARCEAELGGVCSSGHIMQWSGTTHWQQQVTGASLPYPWDFSGMQLRRLQRAPGEFPREFRCCLPEMLQAARAEPNLGCRNPF